MHDQQAEQCKLCTHNVHIVYAGVCAPAITYTRIHVCSGNLCRVKNKIIKLRFFIANELAVFCDHMLVTMVTTVTTTQNAKHIQLYMYMYIQSTCTIICVNHTQHCYLPLPHTPTHKHAHSHVSTDNSPLRFEVFLGQVVMKAASLLIEHTPVGYNVMCGSHPPRSQDHAREVT